MTALEAVAAVGAGALAAGSVCVAWRPLLPLALPTQALGIVLIAVSGVAVLGGAEPLGRGFTDRATPAFGVDGLSGFFLAALALVAVPSLLYARGYLAGSARSRAIAGLTGAFLAALVGVLCARDVLSFLAFWELMTLVPAAAILVGRQSRSVRRAVYVYLSVTHLGGAGVWISLLVLAHHGALAHPGALAQAGAQTQTVVALTALVGFGTKAGLMPMHSWLPRAHPVAPSHVSALMSGMMIKVALYGLIRVLFTWLGAPPLWLGILVVAIGVLSSLGGVVYAIVQHELKRLLAFHSIENVGIVALGLGASLLFAHAHEPRWASVAFAAALLHTLNHAVFKALLFLGAGAFERATHTLELDRLGGLLRRMPWTGWSFLVGAAAIAGVPPLNGFASEWLTLQALVHLTAAKLPTALTGALAAAGLASTAALALFCFAKVTGLVLLGRPRRDETAAAVESPVSMRAGMAVLAVACVVLGAVPALIVPTLAGLHPGAEPVARGTSVRLPGTGALPSLPLLVALTLLVSVLLVARRAGASGRSVVWACGQRLVPALAWTSAGFTKPLRLVLEPALRPQRFAAVRVRDGVVQEVEYHAHVPHLFDTAIYRPAVRLSLRGAAVARRLQSGNLRAYVVYLLLLVLLSLLLARTGALG
ncbi:MAG TPA: proton-conducting transporter membrane subunit [Gaiellaceae bacterium]|nr:proton-conducting transporter membrane subunit [Gaiellaceae bacterium]